MNDNAFNRKGKMMKQNDLFINASQIAEMTNMSEAYAYKLIKQLNQELEQKGFLTIRGRISKEYFQERIYGTIGKDDASI